MGETIAGDQGTLRTTVVMKRGQPVPAEYRLTRARVRTILQASSYERTQQR